MGAGREGLTTVLSGTRETMRPDLEPVFHALIGTAPSTLLRALRADRPTHAMLLTELATGRSTVTHEVLDRLQPAKAVQVLRAVLVAGGALPERDEHLAALEKWLTRAYVRVPLPDERRLLRSFTTWAHLRRLRRLPHPKSLPPHRPPADSNWDARTAAEEPENGVVNRCFPWACSREGQPVQDDFRLAS